jgi:hypothetical protein
MPALGGPSSTIFHSSGENAADVVIRAPQDRCEIKNWSRAGQERAIAIIPGPEPADTIAW